MEHVYLSTMTLDLVTHTGETSDGSQSETDEMMYEHATLAASTSTNSSSDSGTSGEGEPPKEFFDALLEQPWRWWPPLLVVDLCSLKHPALAG